MAGKGPPKIPTNILRLRGSKLAKKRTKEPLPASQRLTCPAWLDAEGKKVWRTLVKQLHAMGVVGSVDVFAVGRYCQLFVRWLEREQDIRDTGSRMAVMNETGDVIGYTLNPSVKIASDLADKLLRLEQHYGMTASSRASLSVAPEKKERAAQSGADKTRFFRQRA